ncbi:MAG: hypothetical protein AAGD13_10280 [Pseudomonadota bacterium]
MARAFSVLWKIVLAGIGLFVVAGALLLLAYFAGARLPVYADTTPVAFPNWNKTRVVEADLLHDSEIWRADGRTHLTANLRMPGAFERLKAFLDGGRSELVVCGPQKLLMHSLVDGRVAINGDLVVVTGTADMELAGLIQARDDWPVRMAVRVGHDRTSVWAEVTDISIGQVPEPMVSEILKRLSRFSYTRTQILELIARDLPEAEAELLRKHQDALDLAFESVVPAESGDAIHLDAVISVDENAILGVLADRFAEASSARAGAFAEAFGPNRAHAQLNLKSLTRELEKIGEKLERELQKQGPDAAKLLEDPEAFIQSLVSGASDCEIMF